MIETITVNGVDLATLVTNVESLAGLLTSPQLRDSRLLVPYQHGRTTQGAQWHDDGAITLPMWVIGADPGTGQVLDGDAGVTAYYQRADTLSALFHAAPLTIRHTLPDGSVRVAVAELEDTPLDFTRQLGSPLFGRFSAVLSIPAAFWADVNPVDTGVLTGTTGSPFTLSAFDGATAPMDQLVVTFGPANNPMLIQDTTGLFVAYDGVIGAGQKLVLDTSTWRLNQVSGSTGISGSLVWAFDERKVRYHPAIARWWQLRVETGGPRVTFTHTGGGTATFAVAGTRTYLLG